ncbi:MAG: insulinase family protein [Terricaulis sp.]
MSQLTADLLSKGTTTRSATEIAREIESLGASLGATSNADSAAVSLQTRSDRVDEAFTVFADVIRNPVFAAEELTGRASRAWTPLGRASSARFDREHGDGARDLWRGAVWRC